MSGKVFISCGQRPPREKSTADKVGKLLKQKFNLDYYLAFKIQRFGRYYENNRRTKVF